MKAALPWSFVALAAALGSPLFAFAAEPGRGVREAMDQVLSGKDPDRRANDLIVLAYPGDAAVLPLAFERLKPNGPLRALTGLHEQLTRKAPAPAAAYLIEHFDEFEKRFAGHPEERLAFLKLAYSPQSGELPDAQLEVIAAHQLAAAAEAASRWDTVPDSVVYGAYRAVLTLDRNLPEPHSAKARGRKLLAQFLLQQAAPLARTLAEGSAPAGGRRPDCLGCVHAFDLPPEVTTTQTPNGAFEDALWMALDHALPAGEGLALHKLYGAALAQAASRYCAAHTLPRAAQFLELADLLHSTPRVKQVRARVDEAVRPQSDLDAANEALARLAAELETLRREQARLVCFAGTMLRVAGSVSEDDDGSGRPRALPKSKLVEMKVSACAKVARPVPPSKGRALLATPRTFRYSAAFETSALADGNLTMANPDGQYETWGRFIERDPKALEAAVARTLRDEAAARVKAAKAEERLKVAPDLCPDLARLAESSK